MPIKRIMFYLISYDITDNKRRMEVAKTLEGFGSRVQYSVFECLLTQEQFDVLMSRLSTMIDQTTDSLRSYRLCHACVDEIVLKGRGEVTQDEDVYIY